MSLPIIVEVVISLIFVYLTFSLLASEIQEVLGTVLQWRAEHLKRSIEVLLSGNDSASQSGAVDLANQLYESPLIKSLNQEATGPIGRAFRLFNQSIGTVYRTLTRSRNVFGNKTSGPSYIPASVFAKSLIDRIQIDEIQELLVNTRLSRFVKDTILIPLNHIVNDLRASTANEFLLNTELRQLEVSLSQIIRDFQERRANLSETIQRLTHKLDAFMSTAQDVLPDNHHLTETFIRRLSYLRRGVANNDLDASVLLKKIQPNLQELVSISDQKSQIYQELATLASAGESTAQKILLKLQEQSLPKSLEKSLVSLAQDTQLRLSNWSEVDALTNQLESWFEHAMDRAGGVYRRNAKAVGFLIGLSIAIGLNVDSLHMLNRFSADPTIRQAISRSAEQLAVENPDLASSENMEGLQASVNETLSNLPLPIGYQQVVIEQQAVAQAAWSYPIPKRWLGWIITAIAISMGAGFWFDLLKKVVGVRKSGQPPT